MSFLDTIQLPTQTSPNQVAPNTGSFLSGVIQPTSQSLNEDKLASEAQVAKANSDYASSWKGMMMNTLSDIGTKITDLAKTGYETFNKASFEAPQQAGAEFGAKLRQGTPAEATAAGLRFGTNVLGAAFSPVTTAFSVAEKIPVLKQAADIINLPFMVTGKVGEFAGDKFTDVLPISKESKDILRPAFKEVGSLVGQIWLGGKVMEKLGGGEVINKEAIDNLKKEAKTQVPETPISTEQHTPVEKKLSKVISDYKAEGYAIPELSQERQPRSPGLRDLTELAKNPEVQALTKEKIKVIPTNEDGTITVYRAGDPISENKISSVTLDRSIAETINQEKKSTAPINEYHVKPEDIKIAIGGFEQELLVDTKILAEGPKMISGLAKHVEQNAIERKLTEGLGQLPEYNKVNMKEQAQHAGDLIASDPEKAMRIAMGQELPPNHILPEAIFTAVENKAIIEKDVETLRRLATESNLSLQATAMGQRIRALGERDQASPVTAIQDVKSARETSIEKKTGKKLKESTDEIAGEIKEKISKPTKETWASFIESIKCNY